MSDSEFLDLLKKLPNNLGHIPMAGISSVPEEPADQEDPWDGAEIQQLPVPGGVPRFDNMDLQDGRFSRKELEAMARMLPSEGVYALTPDMLREMALVKMYKLCGVFRRQYELRAYIEELGGDTNIDLVYSMLSVLGEAGRLRTMIPKLEVEPDPEDDQEDIKEDDAA